MFVEFLQIGDHVPVYGIVAKPLEADRVRFMGLDGCYDAIFQPGDQVYMNKPDGG